MQQIPWEALGTVAGVLSFAFAVYIYFKSRSEEVSEKAKIELYKERLNSLHYQLTSALYATDAIVQMGKDEVATVAMLQNLARLARGHLFTSIKQLEEERSFLENWRYGEMIKSDDLEKPVVEVRNLADP